MKLIDSALSAPFPSAESAFITRVGHGCCQLFVLPDHGLRFQRSANSGAINLGARHISAWIRSPRTRLHVSSLVFQWRSDCRARSKLQKGLTPCLTIGVLLGDLNGSRERLGFATADQSVLNSKPRWEFGSLICRHRESEKNHI